MTPAGWCVVGGWLVTSLGSRLLPRRDHEWPAGCTLDRATLRRAARAHRRSIALLLAWTVAMIATSAWLGVR